MISYNTLVFILLYTGSLRCEEENIGRSSRRPNARRAHETDNAFNRFSQLIEDGENYVELNDANVILVLGNIFSGKTTLTKYLTEENSNLQSVRNRLGGYVIEDDDDKISSSSNAPKTILPDLYYDISTNDAYYDCPGFRPHDVTTEISEAYFMQTVISTAQKFKIIFTIDFADVEDSTHTTDTVYLLESIALYIPDIEHYKNSIALVVTKVKSDDDDRTVITSVAKFLDNIRKEIEGGNVDLTESALENKIPQVLNILLHHSNVTENPYDRIALFRQPDKVGGLDEIDSLQDKKGKLYSMVNSLEYAAQTPVTPSLSSKAYDAAEKFILKARQGIKTSMENTFQGVFTYNNLLLENTNDVFRTLKDIIVPNLHNLKICIDFDTFSIRNMLDCISQYQAGIYDISTNFFDAAINIKHVKILQDIFGADIADDSYTIDYFLTRTDLSITENLIDYITWTEIYSSILQFLDKYENQLDRRNLVDEAVFTTTDSDELISKLASKYNISRGLNIHGQVEESRRNVLHKILKSAADFELTYACVPGGKLIVSGNYIITSQLDIEGKCPGNITSVDILGLYKIFFDGLPEALQTKDLGMVAPKLEQINSSIVMYERTHRARKFWVLSNMNLIKSVSHDYLLSKPCLGQDTPCYGHEFASVINYFKTYALQNSTISKRESIAYFHVLNKRSWPAQIVYDTAGYVDELTQLEGIVDRLANKMDILPIYSSLLERIENYAETPKVGEEGQDYKTALKYLYTATLTKICNMKNGLDNDLIIDIQEYLNLAIDDLEKYKQQSKKESTINLVTKYKDSYNKEIDSKISEATYLVENYLSKVIEDLLSETDAHFDSLLKEIALLKEDIKADISYTQQKYDDLQKIIERKRILAIVSTIGKIFSVFGFWGALFSVALDAGINVANQFLPQGVDFDRQLTQLPEGVLELLDKNSLALEKVENDRMKPLEDKLYVALHYLAAHPTAFPTSLARFREIQLELRSIKYKKSSLEKIDVLKDEIDREIALMKYASQRNRRRLSAASVIDKIQKGTEIVAYSKGLFDECKNDEEKLHKLSAIIMECKGNLKNLDRYEDKLKQLVQPTLDNMKSYVHDLQTGASYQSEVGIIVSKWDMQTTLKDLKFELQKVTSGFQVKDDLARTIEQLYDVLTTMMTIYERIQQYGDNRNLANLVTDIALVSNGGRADNSEIARSIHRLDDVIQRNVILNQYDRIVNAYKQYVFPFADFFLEELTLPAVLINNSTQHVVDNALNILHNLKRKLSVSYATIDQRIDTYLRETTFRSNLTSSKPFYVWRNSQYKGLISSLLAGHEIVLKADIMKNVHVKNAIKFNSIALHLRTIKKSSQDQLDGILKNFGIQMTHMGTSNFRCDNKYYSILSKSQQISYSFERGSDGRPLETNMVYKKIERGDLMLSPYTFWKIKLSSANGMSFDVLKEYENRLHLELIGHGYYVDIKSDVCKMNLEKYYNLANPIYDMVNIIPNLNV